MCHRYVLALCAVIVISSPLMRGVVGQESVPETTPVRGSLIEDRAARKLIEAGDFISAALQRDNQSRSARALGAG